MARTLLILLMGCWAWHGLNGPAQVVVGQEPAAATTRGPALRLDSTEFHWGKVLQGATPTHEFALHNEGDQPLEILSVRPG